MPSRRQPPCSTHGLGAGCRQPWASHPAHPPKNLMGNGKSGRPVSSRYKDSTMWANAPCVAPQPMCTRTCAVRSLGVGVKVPLCRGCECWGTTEAGQVGFVCGSCAPSVKQSGPFQVQPNPTCSSKLGPVQQEQAKHPTCSSMWPPSTPANAPHLAQSGPGVLIGPQQVGVAEEQLGRLAACSEGGGGRAGRHQCSQRVQSGPSGWCVRRPASDVCMLTERAAAVCVPPCYVYKAWRHTYIYI